MNTKARGEVDGRMEENQGMSKANNRGACPHPPARPHGRLPARPPACPLSRSLTLPPLTHPLARPLARPSARPPVRSLASPPVRSLASPLTRPTPARSLTRPSARTEVAVGLGEDGEEVLEDAKDDGGRVGVEDGAGEAEELEPERPRAALADVRRAEHLQQVPQRRLRYQGRGRVV